MALYRPRLTQGGTRRPSRASCCGDCIPDRHPGRSRLGWPADWPLLPSPDTGYAAGQHAASRWRRLLVLGSPSPVRCRVAVARSLNSSLPTATRSRCSSSVYRRSVWPRGHAGLGCRPRSASTEDAVTRVSSHVHCVARRIRTATVDPASLLPVRLPVTPEPSPSLRSWRAAGSLQTERRLPAVAEPRRRPFRSWPSPTGADPQVVEGARRPLRGRSWPQAGGCEWSRRSETPLRRPPPHRAPEAHPGAARRAPALLLKAVLRWLVQRLFGPTAARRCLRKCARSAHALPRCLATAATPSPC